MSGSEGGPSGPTAGPTGAAGGGAFWACFLATLSIMSTGLFFRADAGAALAAVADSWRDWSTAASIACLLALWAVAVRRPALIRPRPLCACSAACVLAGHALTAASVPAASPVLAILGSCLDALGETWLMVAWLLACSTLDTRRMCLCLTGSALAAMALARWAPTPADVPPLVSGGADALLCLAALGVSHALDRGFFERLAACEAPASLQITRPGAVLPATHGVFLTIFAFSLAFGYAQRYEAGLDIASSQAAPALAMALVLGCAAARKARPRADVLFGLSFVLVVAGFLLVLVDDAATGAAAGGLLMAGYLCFELLMWFVFCSVAARSTAEAVPVIAWGTAVSYAGILMGAQLGILTTSSPLAAVGGGLASKLVVAAAVLAVVAYVALRGGARGFDAAIDGVEPDRPAQAQVRYIDRLEERCRRAVEEYGLTQREAEMLEQLARGNNPAHIQEALSISRNTVKYHCKNIYDKLGVHSQQEVIDLLSAEDAGGAEGPGAAGAGGR